MSRSTAARSVCDDRFESILGAIAEIAFLKRKLHMSKEKVVVFFFDDESGSDGFIIVSIDKQVRAIPVEGSVHGPSGEVLKDFEILTEKSESVMQEWEQAGYTQLSEVAAFFDLQNGNMVRPLRKFPGGETIRYIASAPGPVYTTGMTAEEALAKLGTPVPSYTASTSPAAIVSEAQTTADVKSNQVTQAPLPQPSFLTLEERRLKTPSEVDTVGVTPRKPWASPKKKG
ncbi:hypothetical protein E4A48_11635 [Xanthomonas cerealis pv. cerealis]|uniref:Uncharacterized protein n=1 Tax=Xanthomonas cerealis pv. cerealis TaxID=152263 RepID=A0A514EDY9_9XANT|nr:hypothetical protein [Xanthomonas translucens]QDI04257.1 hypothetical protein E4A48_11635 [Xanthomonas translucens pv. cerealis]